MVRSAASYASGAGGSTMKTPGGFDFPQFR
jgi:hypothetical protein